MLSVTEKAGVVAVGQVTCGMEQMTCDSPARMEGQDECQESGCGVIVTTYLWRQYSSSSRLELSITSPFRAGGKLCRRWPHVFPIILSISITLSVISIVFVVVLPTRSAACKLCRSSSVVLTVML